MTDQAERLQKYLARAGVASRRAAEGLITAGRVKVNGVVVRELGTTVDPLTDEVEFDGERIGVDVRHVYLLANKPPAMISASSDPEGRPVVTSLVPAEYGRLYPVGRLDWDSEGAILLTNDGELANLLTHPRHEVRKTYMVKVKGLVGDADRKIDKLREGVRLDDGRRTLPAEVIRDSDTGKHTWFVVSIREGRNRQIRRMFEAVSLDVLRLRRIAYGPVALGDVQPGEFRRLTEEEIDELYEAAGQKRPRLSASRGRLPRAKRAAVERRAHAAATPEAPTARTKKSAAKPRGKGEPRSTRESRAAKPDAARSSSTGTRSSSAGTRSSSTGTRSGRAERDPAADRGAKPGRPTKPERPTKPGRPAKAERPTKPGRPARPAEDGARTSKATAGAGKSSPKRRDQTPANGPGGKRDRPAPDRGSKPAPRPKHRGARGRTKRGGSDT